MQQLEITQKMKEVLLNYFKINIAKYTLIGVSIITLFIFIKYLNLKYHLRQRVFNTVWMFLGPIIERQINSYKKELFEEAYGRVLDVGSGFGPTFKFLSNEGVESGSSKKPKPISEVVAIEPNPFMLTKLKNVVKEAQNKFNVKIIAKTLQQAIKDNDLEYGSFDTIICNLVLCSIPNQQSTLNEIQKLLKPGGKFLFLEHIGSENNVISKFQTILNPIWGLFADGCKLNRHTDSAIKNINTWEKVSINYVKTPQLLRNIYGVAVKESSLPK